MREIWLPREEPFINLVEMAVMRKKHLDEVMTIERQVYPSPWSRAVFEAELVQGITRSYFVAIYKKDIVGYCGTLYVIDEAHITNIAVSPYYQRKHIATKILSHMVRLSIERQMKAITLEVRVSNLAAQRLYQKFGFQPAGIRKGYYQENGEDALIMWAYDIDSPQYRERLLGIEAGAGIVLNARPKRRRIW